MKAYIRYTIAALLLAVGCNSPSGPDISAVDLRNGVVQGYTVPDYVITLGGNLGDTLISSVLNAGTIQGRKPGDPMIVSGTITYTPSNDTTIVEYASEPTDRLRIIYPDGSIYTYSFADFTSAEYTCGNHEMRFTVTDGKGTTLFIHETRTEYQIQRVVQGTVVHHGNSYQVDLIVQGANVCSDGMRQLHTTGTISGRDLSITVDEECLRNTETDNTVRCRRVMRNRWTWGGGEYRFESGEVGSSFIGDRPDNRAAHWYATGELLYNEQTTFDLQCAVKGAEARVWTDTPAGEIVLERWAF